MLQFGMPTLIEIESLEETMQLCKELGLSFVELNMNLPQYQIEHLEDTSYLKALNKKYQIGYTIHLDENLNVCDFNKAVAGAYIDTVDRTIQVANIDEKFIMANSGKLCHFYVHDSLGKNDHMTLGTGEIDLAQRFRIAKDCQCRCVIETKTIEALNKSVLWLRL